MSAFRIVTATKHIRTLSQPFRRTFYSPFAVLQQQPSLTTTKSPSSSTHNSAGAAHEHEHEHTTRTLHVVSEPNAADVKYGVPIGAYPNAAPFHPTPGNATHENVSTSLTSSTARNSHSPAGVISLAVCTLSAMAQSGGPILTDEGGNDTSLLRVQRQQRFFCMHGR